MNHGRGFKELLLAFFVEFLELFLPDVLKYLDIKSIVFLDKEVFADVTSGTVKEVDVLVRARFKGQKTTFLIHIENESSAKKIFPKRMFRYFARLGDRFDMPVYPVAILSYDTPKTLAPNSFDIAFPGKNVLHFEYATIQLNRFAWKQFVNNPNPVANALMTKMNIALRDRTKVKLECMRMLTTLKLAPAKSQIIGGFIEGYLKLTAEEAVRFERSFAKLDTVTKKATMEMWTSWGREGMEKGLQQGRQEIVIRLIRRPLGSVPTEAAGRIKNLASEQLDELGEALLDFSTFDDLETWLARHQSN